MLTPEIRYYKWEELKDKIQVLFFHIEDELDRKYKPYGNTPDLDAPYVEQLFKTLDVLNDFAVEHSEKLEQEYSDWLVLQDEETLDDMLHDALSWIYIDLGDFTALDERGCELVA